MAPKTPSPLTAANKLKNTSSDTDGGWATNALATDVRTLANTILSIEAKLDPIVNSPYENGLTQLREFVVHVHELLHLDKAQSPELTVAEKLATVGAPDLSPEELEGLSGEPECQACGESWKTHKRRCSGSFVIPTEHASNDTNMSEAKRARSAPEHPCSMSSHSWAAGERRCQCGSAYRRRAAGWMTASKLTDEEIKDKIISVPNDVLHGAQSENTARIQLGKHRDSQSANVSEPPFVEDRPQNPTQPERPRGQYSDDQMALPEMCLELHMGNTQSYIDPDRRKELMDFIQWKLGHWEAPHHQSRWREFDDAIRALCIATIAECDSTRVDGVG